LEEIKQSFLNKEGKEGFLLRVANCGLQSARLEGNILTFFNLNGYCFFWQVAICLRVFTFIRLDWIFLQLQRKLLRSNLERMPISKSKFLVFQSEVTHLGV